jgi:hypothetical protein
MLSQNEIENIAKQVATANLSSTNVSSAISAPGFDSEGHEALRITIVLTPASTATINGDKLLDTLVQIQDQLRKRGEERLPIIEYATTKELEEKESIDSE